MRIDVDALGSDLVEIYYDIEAELIINIAKRFRVDAVPGDIQDWRIDRLNELAGINRENIKKIAKYANVTEAAIENYLKAAGYEVLSADEAAYKTAYEQGALDVIPRDIGLSQTLNRVTQLAIDNMRMEFNLINTTALESAQRGYLKIVNKAYVETITGVKDYITSVREAVKGLADRDITGATYVRNGRIYNTHIDVAVRRAILTSTNNITGDLQLARAAEWGCNLVEVSSHLGARPEHAIWQGGIYSITGGTAQYPNLVEATGYGTATGLMGINCRHDMYPFFEGISELAQPQYDLEENQRAYEDAQRMRKLERDVRQQKRRILAAEEIGDVEGKLAAQIKLKEKEAILKEFAHKSGQGYESSRAQVMGFGRSEAQKAVWAKQKASHLAGTV